MSDYIDFDDELNALADKVEKPEYIVKSLIEEKAPLLYCNWTSAFKSEKEQKKFALNFINEIEPLIYDLEFSGDDLKLINKAKSALRKAYIIGGVQ